YQEEADDIGPGDDHLRLWKKNLFNEIVGVLEAARASGLLGLPCFLVVQYPDAGPAMSAWIRAGVRRLNPPTMCAAWEGD
ncbi:unnamed protein product, partial [Laminaria digitata]